MAHGRPPANLPAVMAARLNRAWLHGRLAFVSGGRCGISARPEAGRRVAWFVVPDGLLNLVNLAALPDGDGYLVERGTAIHYLTTERDFAVAGTQRQRKQQTSVVGGPAFDEDAPVAAGTPTRGTECQALFRCASLDSQVR